MKACGQTKSLEIFINTSNKAKNNILYNPCHFFHRYLFLFSQKNGKKFNLSRRRKVASIFFFQKGGGGPKYTGSNYILDRKIGES